MFEKQVTVRDLLLYMIPGILTLSFALRVYDIVFDKAVAAYLLSDWIYASLFIALAFIVGFFQSNYSIKWFNSYLYHKKKHFISYFNPLGWVLRILKKLDSEEYKDQLILAACGLSDEFKDRIVENYKRDFLISTPDDKIMASEETFHLCYRYTEQFAEEKALRYPRRSLNLANFSAAACLPIIWTTLFVTAQLNVAIWIKAILIIFFVIFIIVMCANRYNNYRNAWIKNTFRIYLIVSNKNEKDFILETAKADKVA